MKTSDLIEGLTILEKYRDKKNWHDTIACQGVLYALATDQPVQEPDLVRLVECGWIQDGIDLDDGSGDFEPRHYDPNEKWAARL